MNLARAAIREYDGANAKGLPIKLTIMPSGPGRGSRPDNPFDRVEPPRRSLFERVERPRDRSASPVGAENGSYDDRRTASRRGGGRLGDSNDRRSDVSKPAPEHIDRYVPGQGNHSPPPRRRGLPPREGGRRPGQRRENGGRERNRDRDRDDSGHKMVNGRPRKTAEELDQEMEDYWGNMNATNGPAVGDTNVNGETDAGGAAEDGDVAQPAVEEADEGLGEVDMGIIE